MPMTAAQIAALDRADPNSLADAFRDIAIGTKLNTIDTQLGLLDDATVVAPLTEAAGAIGGTNNSDIPSLTATAATLTGTLTGTANGAMVDVAATAGACGGGATPANTDVDTAIATAVAPIVTGVNEQNKEMQAQINALIADNVALRAAIRECAAKVNELQAVLVDANLAADA